MYHSILMNLCHNVYLDADTIRILVISVQKVGNQVISQNLVSTLEATISILVKLGPCLNLGSNGYTISSLWQLLHMYLALSWVLKGLNHPLTGIKHIFFIKVYINHATMRQGRS